MKKIVSICFICLLLVSCGNKQKGNDSEIDNAPEQKETAPNESVQEDDSADHVDEEGDWEEEYKENLEKYDVDDVPDVYLPSPVASVITDQSGASLLRAPTSDAVNLTVPYGQTITVLAVTYGLGGIGNWCFIECKGVYGWVETAQLDSSHLL